MSFFTPAPPEDDDEDEDVEPAWTHAPENEIGVVVPVERIAAQTEAAVVAVRALVVYSSGFELQVEGRTRPADEADDEPFDHEHHWRHSDPRSAHFLRLGLQYADGQRATNLEDTWPEDDAAEPDSLTLVGDPDGGGDHVHLRYWVLPLPPPGPVTLVCEWLAYGIAETRLELDADAIRSAAASPIVFGSQIG